MFTILVITYIISNVEKLGGIPAITFLPLNITNEVLFAVLLTYVAIDRAFSFWKKFIRKNGVKSYEDMKIIVSECLSKIK